MQAFIHSLIAIAERQGWILCKTLNLSLKQATRNNIQTISVTHKHHHTDYNSASTTIQIYIQVVSINQTGRECPVLTDSGLLEIKGVQVIETHLYIVRGCTLYECFPFQN